MKTTPKHFNLFRKEAIYWIKRFGLIGWDITFIHGEQNEDNLASISFNVAGAWCIFYLNTDWDDNILNNLEVRKSAFHEVCELMHGKFFVLATSRYISEDQLHAASHEIIRILENAFFENSNRLKTSKT
jgi:hypothetical protein